MGYDKCSETTTTVAWKKSCDGNAAGTQFDMLKPGTYFLKYSCKDDAGLKTTACRTFVNLDKTKPVITILEAANANDGTWHIEASRDNNYVDAGATCSDTGASQTITVEASFPYTEESSTCTDTLDGAK